MSQELTVIIGRSFEHGRNWLRQNAKKYNLDPQQCRITNRAEVLKGLENYTIIWLRGWAACVNASAIRAEANAARAKGRIKQEIAP